MSTADPMALRQQLGTRFASELEALRQASPGILAAQVCTADGICVASSATDAEAGRRLAAIVCSLHALGVAVVQDMALGKHSHLGIEASGGKCALFDLPSSAGQLLLAASCNETVVWVQFLPLCQAFTQKLDRLLADHST